ncbi:MAG: hypothetical protein ABIQ90_00510 [Polaromonas sp.]
MQLTNPNDRRCGAGPQLGYQHSRREFVYILNGDMEILEGFLEKVLDFIMVHPDVAGIGGRVVELNTESLKYIARCQRVKAHMLPGKVDRLDGGVVYRRSDEAAGYFSDRNLHSYEEFDLTVLLRSLGWRLWRLPVNVAHHLGHDAPVYRLLMRRWHAHYLCGLGELLRSSVGQRRLPCAPTSARTAHLFGRSGMNAGFARCTLLKLVAYFAPRLVFCFTLSPTAADALVPPFFQQGHL